MKGDIRLHYTEITAQIMGHWRWRTASMSCYALGGAPCAPNLGRQPTEASGIRRRRARRAGTREHMNRGYRGCVPYYVLAVKAERVIADIAVTGQPFFMQASPRAARAS
jgi:hypothetical protein